MKFTKDQFYGITKHKALYSIMPLENIPSILENGILSHNLASVLDPRHKSVALEDVQEKREMKITNAGKGIHSYVNLYFDPHNPMLSRLREKNEKLCILAINPEVLNIEDVVVTDRNAATSIVKFIEPQQMTKVLDFDRIYMKYWKDSDKKIYAENKAIKCAEVLVPDKIPTHYIMGAVVINNTVKTKLEELGFNKEIFIDKCRFF